ncbi:MAG: hypothetical protein HY720_18690 [Planctomycetes bacterium]|nr:hypothetical protein [Planctomycetota bacterium]
MAIRVRLLLETTGPAPKNALVTAAVLNGGFESESPCLLLPATAAGRILRSLPEEGRPVIAEVAGGRTDFVYVQENLEGRIRVQDREGPSSHFEVLISAGETEVLVSDTGIDVLGVEIVSFGRGLWRFHGESIVRPSEPAEHW